MGRGARVGSSRPTAAIAWRAFRDHANGPLHRPKLQGIPGIDSFQGHSFHTSRWDCAYTGGDTTGNLTGLRDKIVGIIGTGATAVQCVPHLGRWARHLDVFQRAPSSVDVRGNRPTDPEWAKRLTLGWQQQRMEDFNILVPGGFQEVDLVDDAWTDLIRKLLVLVRQDEKPDVSRAALEPYYRQFCKRPCFHDEYLDTFNRPNVSLVDTMGKGVERITEKGIVANGVEYPLDCIIYSTGFEVGTAYTHRSGYDLLGAGSLKLSEKWSEGVRTLHGMHSRGSPSCFIMNTAQSGFTASFPHTLDEQSRHIAYILRRAFDEWIRRIEVTAEAEDAWVESVIRKARLGLRFYEECTPGCYNNEGRPGERSGQDTAYGGGSMEFFEILRKWRDDAEMRGLELRR